MAETLAGARSPFLQHGAKQPVRWLPWGDAAFERARRENKPILLDIGAVWCHWCHVMDRESYEDEATAALINDNFVAVKVDRDERPDVDARYQRAVQAMTGQGGWPLTAFLTPDGETYYGGTYFPPTDQYGRPSFQHVLNEVARVWRDEPERAREAVNGIRERLRTYAQAEAERGRISPDTINQTVEEFAEAFDFRYGGFGRAPKFPNAGGLALLIDHHLDTRLEWSWRMVEETLDAMARGGIYDQIGGGFHRYATDARWLIPHFEKMSYDNGPLLEVYARAFACSRSRLYDDTVRGILAYYDDVALDVLQRGGFPASQDADFSPHDDGDYWTWTRDEMAAVLTPTELSVAVEYFGLEDPDSAMHLDPQRHVLYRARPVDDAVVEQQIAGKLKRAREARPQPYVDKTIYTGWSALVASGYIAAVRYCAAEWARMPALLALEAIWSEAFDPARGVTHRMGDRDAGEYLDDQAYVLQAFLDAFELTQHPDWLTRAQTLLDLTTQWYQDASGAYRDRPRDAAAPVSSLHEPHYPIADAPTPAGNAVMALNLLRLAALTHDDAQRVSAESLLAAFAGSAPRLATAAATYVRALGWLTSPITTVVVVGRSEAAEEEPLLAAALGVYRPRTVVRYFAAGRVASDQLPAELSAMLSGDAPRAYVCAGTTCAAPVTDAEALEDLLRTFHGDTNAIT
ncbi:MAG TPA: thioredoxin domain-containing protein [Longimicrobiales bacterium]